MLFAQVLLVVCVGLAEVCCAKPVNGTIQIAGSKFFNGVTKEQFFVKGIAYQSAKPIKGHDLAYVDSLSNPGTCARDVKYLSDLGVNVVRVYQIDPEASHDECMAIMREAGIYVMMDLSEPNSSINRDSPTWDVELRDRFVSVVEAMSEYENTMGFIVGNEVTTSKINTDASPFVKAAIRDVRAYLERNGKRNVPLGYATNDDSEIRRSIAEYFVCGDKETTADFIAINMYEWCGYSSYATSGYRDRTVEFGNFPVPLFFGEYGCNTYSPRPFTEIEALYGSTMSKVWSGGLAYEYFDNVNHYGVVEEKDDGTVKTLPDFEILKSRLGDAKPVGSAVLEADRSSTKVACPAQNSIWKASTQLPPTPDAGKCECLQSTFSCILSPYKDTDLYQLLNEVCSQIDCSGIKADGETGSYGIYSDCSMKQRISWALNSYFVKNGKRPASCDFQGRAVPITSIGFDNLKSMATGDGRRCGEALGYSDKNQEENRSFGNSTRIAGDGKKAKNINSLKTNGASSPQAGFDIFLLVLVLFGMLYT